MKPRFLFEAHIRMEESPRRPRLLVENDGVRGRADAAGTGGGVERSWAWADAAALRGWGLRRGEMCIASLCLSQVSVQGGQARDRLLEAKSADDEGLAGRHGSRPSPVHFGRPEGARRAGVA